MGTVRVLGAVAGGLLLLATSASVLQALVMPGGRVGRLFRAVDQIIDRLVEWAAFTPLQNATGDPAISLPLGESSSGLPVGMMLSAVCGQEARLLELAYELEEARPWARIQS